MYTTVFSGPNQALMSDLDENGIPDYPELVAQTAEEVFELYQLEGFAEPVSEEEMGLGEFGGSEGFDFISLISEAVLTVIWGLMPAVRLSALARWSSKMILRDMVIARSRKPQGCW